MNMKNICLILTSGIVCAFIVYYSWTLYSEVKVLKSTLAELENNSAKSLQMNITNDNDNDNEH